jgi:hypothetical protein
MKQICVVCGLDFESKDLTRLGDLTVMVPASDDFNPVCVPCLDDLDESADRPTGHLILSLIRLTPNSVAWYSGNRPHEIACKV